MKTEQTTNSAEEQQKQRQQLDEVISKFKQTAHNQNAFRVGNINR